MSSHCSLGEASYSVCFVCFRRPTSDMNIASGCPLFCQLAQIEQTLPAYLKDDTMFIKIIVDTADL